jgi:type 2 lantibiotic biosynthesis protein LanM
MTDSVGDPEKRRLAWRAQTLFERVEVNRTSGGSRPTDAERRPPADSDSEAEAATDADRFFEELRERLGGSEATLERRLTLDGRSKDDCRACFRRETWPEGRPLPAWIDALESLVAFVASNDCAGFDEPLDGGDSSNYDEPPDGDDPRNSDIPSDRDAADPYPFEEILRPWVAFARSETSRKFETLTDDALDSLSEWLLGRLAEASSEALFLEFKLHLAERDPDGAESATPESDGERPPRTRYVEFADRLRTAEGLWSLFGDYPVLARLAVETVEQWVETVGEFDRRLERDQSDLREAFGEDDSLGPVADVAVLSGDPHDRGRVPFRVEFAAGPTVAYKPRCLRPERLFGEALEAVSEGVGLAFETPTCLCRDGYGWMEWMAHEPCSSPAAVSRYYRRAGGLTCLAYALGVTDCHFENVVAHGEHPVVVDAETAFHPPLPDAVARKAASERSVVRTGLLPLDRDGYSIGGFTGTVAEARAKRRESASWSHPNTDAMEYEAETYRPDRKRNLPVLDGEREALADHLDAFERGFRLVYRELAERGPELVDGWAREGHLDAATTRVIPAPTKLYASVLRAATSAASLSSGLELTLKLEGAVSGVVAEERVGDRLWWVCQQERAALQRADVPRFAATPTARAIRSGGDACETFFDCSGYQTTRERLTDFDESDLRTQLERVRTAVGESAE